MVVHWVFALVRCSLQLGTYEVIVSILRLVLSYNFYLFFLNVKSDGFLVALTFDIGNVVRSLSNRYDSSPS